MTVDRRVVGALIVTMTGMSVIIIRNGIVNSMGMDAMIFIGWLTGVVGGTWLGVLFQSQKYEEKDEKEDRAQREEQERPYPEDV